MEIIPFVREGLGNSSYLAQLGDDQAVLIDPDRSIDRYLETAQSRAWKIIAVFETHLHADFVSGAVEVAHASGAQVYLPQAADAQFPHQALAAGQKLELSGVQVECIASAGHTPEHLSYVLRSERQAPALFSGGALIVGGAARTDLISSQMTEPLTRAEFRTLTTAFSSLGDETGLYPTHGGGSFCSVGAGGRRTSTLGEERARNPLLQIEDEEEFVRWFPTTFPPSVPDYFFRMRPINQAGPRLRANVPNPPALSPAEFDEARRHGLVMDVRPFEAYAEAHIPDAINNTFRDVFATFLGWVVTPQTPLLFVLGDVPLEQVIDEALLVGHESFAGWLDGGMGAWGKESLPVQQIEVADADRARRLALEGAVVLDVREPNELLSGHIEGAINLPVGMLEANVAQVPKDRPILAYCGHGERSSTALSLLERAGIGPLINLRGGLGAWTDAGYKVA